MSLYYFQSVFTVLPISVFKTESSCLSEIVQRNVALLDPTQFTHIKLIYVFYKNIHKFIVFSISEIKFHEFNSFFLASLHHFLNGGKIVKHVTLYMYVR